MIEKRRVLFVSDTLAGTTGLAYIAKNFVDFFYRKNWTIGYANIAGKDISKLEDCKVQGQDFLKVAKNTQFYNVQLFDKNKSNLFDDVIKKFKPDVVISIHDPWTLDQIAYSAYRHTFFWAAYLTIEAPVYPDHVIYPTHVFPHLRKSIKYTLQSVDLCIPCTKMAYNALQDWNLNLVDNVYCGIDLSQKIKEPVLKKSVFGPNVEEDDFIFITVGINSERKRLHKVIDSFEKFLDKIRETKYEGIFDDYKKYKLYIHSDFDKSQGGTDLKSVIKESPYRSQIYLPGNYVSGIGVSKKELYRKYKASDCYIGLSSGEGFGYGYVEAAMHSKPVIYINYGGHVEFCKDFGLSVKVNDYIYAINAAIKWAIADSNDCANQMIKIASDKKLYNKLSSKCLQTIKQFDWKDVMEQFYTIFSQFYKKWRINTSISKVYSKRII